MLDEILQFSQALAPATGLPMGARVLRECKSRCVRQVSRGHRRERCQGQRRWREWLPHPGFPALGPSPAGAHPSGHAELGDLPPGDSLFLGPGRHTPIAGIGPVVAGFLMAPHGLNTQLTTGAFQHLHRVTTAHHQRLPEGCQPLTQINQRLSAEGPLPT